jgi:FecR protein
MTMKTPSRLSAILLARSAPAIITRRGFVLGGAALAAGLAAPPLWAQRNAPAVRSLSGLVRVNGERASNTAPIGAGDTVSTGPDGRISFVVGGDAFFLRENSELKIEASSAGRNIVNSLRMLTGALGSVFAKRRGGQVLLQTPTVTAGIRGTGCYTEVRDEGVYFCTCFGAIELTSAAGGQRELVVASHHDARMVMRDAGSGSSIIPSSVGRHTDVEMDNLEKLVGRRAPWIGTPDENKPYPPGA